MISGVYGTAEFQPGMEEIEELSSVSTPTPVATSAASVMTPVAEIPIDTEVDATAAGNEGLSLTQKALFLAVIFGIVAVFIRMNTRSSSRGVYRQV